MNTAVALLALACVVFALAGVLAYNSGRWYPTIAYLVLSAISAVLTDIYYREGGRE